MLRRDRQIRTQVHQVTDALLFAASLWLACLLRANPQVALALRLDPIGPEFFDKVAWLYFLLLPAAPLILESQGFYNRPVIYPRRLIIWPLFKGCLIITVGLVLAMFAFHIPSARGGMVFFGVFGFILVFLKEEIFRLALHSTMAKLQYKRRVILVGTDKEVARMRHDLDSRPQEGIQVVGEFNFIDMPLQRLVDLLHEHSVSGVIVNAKQAYFERVESVIKICELEGVEAWLIADFFGAQIAHATLDEWHGHPLLVFRTTREAAWEHLVKLLLDFFGALILLLLFTVIIPVIPLIALGIRLTSPGPIFFKQKRSGLNGAPFTLYKFRTMVTNAEQFQHELAAMNEMSGPVFKVTNDPRVTPIGKFLRKWSLDELPQLYNVLRGEMSLVGPRPLPVDEVKRFNDLAHRRRLSVKPGLTCLWQVKGRNQISDFQEWVRLDLEYIDNWSFWLDLKILLLTIPAVLRGTGAK